MHVAIRIDRAYLSTDEEIGCGRLCRLQIPDLPFLPEGHQDEADVMLGCHGVGRTAHLDLQGLVVQTCEVGDVTLHTGLCGVRLQFLHLSAAAEWCDAAVGHFDDDVTAMVAFEEFKFHNWFVLKG